MRIGLGLSIPELATRGGRFSPASLFTGGTVGAWYDPSDYSTLFQDSAGTTPVTAVEQPVGLMLDKSQGLVLGSELVTNGDFSGGLTGWTNGSTGTGSATAPSGAAVLIGIDSSNAARISQGNTVAGKTYKVTFDLTMTSGTAVVEIGGTFRLFTTSGSRSYYEVATNTSGYVIRTPGGGGNFTIDNVSIKELPGNHASQATSTSRPVLRARYNLLTYSEQFDNAAWTKANATITANATTAPDGTTTADKLTEDTVNTQHRATQSITSVTGATYSGSVYLKPAERTICRVILFGTGVYAGGFVDLSTGTVTSTLAGTVSVTAANNGFYRVSVSGASDSTTSALYVNLISTGTTVSYTGDGTSGIYIWGADLRTGSSAGTYQRIAAATDYATAGFLPYLALSTDDSFGTNSINFSATDKMSTVVGATKLSDSALAILAELSADASSNNGSFFILAPSGASPSIRFDNRGTNSALAGVSASAYAAPYVFVASGLGDISGDRATLRLNGTQVAQATNDQGTGNYGNYPLFIGRRNNASFPFEGRIYGLIVAGKTLSASELSATEAWMNSKTGAY